jgi:release factor glutamine methyltransferase
MCCGVGNIGVAIAAALPGAYVWSADLTDECVAAARRNVSLHALEERVSIVQGDLFAPLAELGLEGSVDMIVCNPPYISSGRLAADRAHLLEHEPREAFDAGPYGLSIHQRVVRDAPSFLRPGGHLLMELGEGQACQVGRLVERSGCYTSIRFASDASGVERVVIAERLS